MVPSASEDPTELNWKVVNSALPLAGVTEAAATGNTLSSTVTVTDLELVAAWLSVTVTVAVYVPAVV